MTDQQRTGRPARRPRPHLRSAAGAALLKKIPVQLLKLIFAGLILYSGVRLLMG